MFEHKWVARGLIMCDLVRCEGCEDLHVVEPEEGGISIFVEPDGNEAVCLLCKKTAKEAYGTECEFLTKIQQN